MTRKLAPEQVDELRATMQAALKFNVLTEGGMVLYIMQRELAADATDICNKAVRRGHLVIWTDGIAYEIYNRKRRRFVNWRTDDQVIEPHTGPWPWEGIER